MYILKNELEIISDDSKYCEYKFICSHECELSGHPHISNEIQECPSNNVCCLQPQIHDINFLIKHACLSVFCVAAI